METKLGRIAGRAAQEKRQSVKTQQGGIFDSPQCKVTISKEGRKLSGQSDRQYTERSAQSLKAEKMIQRQESEQPDETLMSEYSDLLEEINKTIRSMQNSNMTGADKEALKKRQMVVNAIGAQKQKQVEENQKKAKEAQQMAMQSSRMQDEIDENNQNLFVMLKSIEESEKVEEEREGGKTQEDGGSSNQTENSVSDSIQNSALHFAASSMKREMNVAGMIDALQGEGYQYLARADEIAQNAFSEAQSIEKLLQDENYTDAEKSEAVFSYGSKMGRDSSNDLDILLSKYRTDREKAEALEHYHMMMKRNSDFSDYRRNGMQLVRDAKDCESYHFAMNPLLGMEQTRDSMMQSAVDAAFNEASQGKLDETSQELEDKVKELIDERNDIDHTKPEEDEEKQKEIGELPEAEEDKENMNAADEEQGRITQG